jgi:alkylated DNA repair dioxygenase AlkB
MATKCGRDIVLCSKALASSYTIATLYQDFLHNPVEVMSQLDLDVKPHLVRKEIFLYGRMCREKRQTLVYRKGGLPGEFRYSGQTQLSHDAPIPVLDLLFRQVEEATRIPFNYVFINRYDGGEDSLGWHRDDEKEHACFTISSLTLGTERRFSIREDHAICKGQKPMFDERLPHNSLLVMNPVMQALCKHSVLPEKKVMGARWNLTYRVFHTQ